MRFAPELLCDLTRILQIVRGLLDGELGSEHFYNEIFINRIKKNVTDKGKRNIPAQIDSLFVYKKSNSAQYIDVLKRLPNTKPAYWHSMESAGIPGPRQVVIDGKTFFPTGTSHFKFTQVQADEMIAQGRIRVNPKTGKPQYLVQEKESVNLDTNWTDIPGYAFTTGFQTENSESLLRRVIASSSKDNDFVMDYFLGSGTTIAVAQKLGRKWLGIEMGEQFYSFVLPRIKRVLFGDTTTVSRVVDWQGGGFVKYYDLEQYEDTVRKAVYHDADLFNNPYEDPYHSYIFLRDEKMLAALDIDTASNAVHLHPERLYPDIDLAETISQRRGKWIKRITREYVEFQDGEKQSLIDPDWQILKPLIWW